MRLASFLGLMFSLLALSGCDRPQTCSTCAEGDTGGESETGGWPFCSEQLDQATCDANGGCVWQEIVEVEFDAGDACVVTPTTRGVCAAAEGEDGCGIDPDQTGCQGLLGFHREVEPGKWELVEGWSCYGPGFEWTQCSVAAGEFSSEEPQCGCLCGL